MWLAICALACSGVTCSSVASRSSSRFTVVIGFVSDHFQNALSYEAGDALCFSLCVAMLVVVVGTICYSFAMASFDRNKLDKLRTDDSGCYGSDV